MFHCLTVHYAAFAIDFGAFAVIVLYSVTLSPPFCPPPPSKHGAKDDISNAGGQTTVTISWLFLEKEDLYFPQSYSYIILLTMLW